MVGDSRTYARVWSTATPGVDIPLISRLMIPCERNIPTSARFSLNHHGRPVVLDHIGPGGARPPCSSLTH
jgi:hypothetical protein